MAGKGKQVGNAPEITPAPLSPSTASPRRDDAPVTVEFAKPWRHNGRDYAAGSKEVVSMAEREQLLRAGAIVGTDR